MCPSTSWQHWGLFYFIFSNNYGINIPVAIYLHLSWCLKIICGPSLVVLWPTEGSRPQKPLAYIAAELCWLQQHLSTFLQKISVSTSSSEAALAGSNMDECLHHNNCLVAEQRQGRSESSWGELNPWQLRSQKQTFLENFKLSVPSIWKHGEIITLERVIFCWITKYILHKQIKWLK